MYLLGCVLHLQKRKVGSKGEIFPPKDIREKLGLRPGREIDLKVDGDKLVVQVLPKVREIISEPSSVEISLEEFHNFRRQLSKKAESTG